MERTLTRVPVLLFVIALFSTTVFAQMEVPKPGPEHKKLDYFVGNWNSDGELKASAMGPGGKMHIDEQTEWMEGGYFVVIHSKFSSASMGKGSGIAFMGYDPQEKVYTYDEFNSMGQVAHSRGTVEGDNWVWTSDMKMGPQTMKTRFSMKIVSPTSYTYKFEMSPDGTNWSLVMEGKDTKTK